MRHSLSCLSFLFIALVSCQKDRIATVIPNHVDRMEDLVAPEGFTYNMFEDHSFSLKVNGPAYYGRVKVLVYGLSEGRRDLIFETMQVVNDTAVIEFPAGQLYQSFAAEAFFGNGQHAVGAWSKNALYAEIGVLDQRKPEHFTSIHKAAGSDCSTCDTVLTSGSSFTVPANGTLCLGAGMSGYTVTVGDGGHLKICGTHIGVDHIYLGVGATISISDGASLTFANGKGLHFGENSSALVHQGGIFTSMGALQWDQGASLVSYGTVYVDGHVNLSKGANLTNFGTFAAKGHIEVEGAGTELLNYGLLYNVSNDHIRVADTAKIINHCHLHSDQHIWIDTYAELINNNQIDCDHRLKIYDEGLLTLGSTSIAVSQDLELKGGLVKSSGVSTAVLKITHDALYFGNARVQGNVDLCIGGLNQNTENLSLSGNARFSCASAVPTSMCITIGHDPGLDSDGDNVANAIDPFPNDSSRCGTICRSSSTLIFEDNWPYKGDYDFNDLVMSYSLWGITNSDGLLKDIYFRYKVRAKGASYQNGFGIEFNTDPQNVTTPVVENGNPLTSSSIILGKVDDLLNAWNTDSLKILDFVDIPWDTVVFTFLVPVSDSVIDSFNPFIIVNQNRTREVHLVDHKPTSMASSSWFGMGDDHSIPASAGFYKTEQNQPWALHVPIIFDYPVEGEDITGVYHYFSDWATSGGSTSQDWYDSEKPGNAKRRKLYK